MRAARGRWALALALALPACSGPTTTTSPEGAGAETPRAAEARSPITITIVGTNDLHGHLDRLPLLGGYLSVLREARAADGGAVVLLDGGDMFQGTLESNLGEGAAVVTAYEALGYDAVTIGNHEFDYGPVGELTVPASPDDDPRGALRARIAEADFPVLSANAVIAATGAPMGIGELPRTTIERAGVRIGLIGVTTESTLRTTLHGNVADLRIDPLPGTIAREAAALREGGATLVVVLAHAGGRCQHFDDPHDLSSCDAHEEIFDVAEALPEGSVDVIVAGHTHQAVAHFVHGIAILESHAYGRAFGRADVTIEAGSGRVLDVHVHPPHDLCRARPEEGSDPSACRRDPYDGHEISADARLSGVIAPAMEAARAVGEERLGPTLSGRFRHEWGAECAVGNLFTDLMRAARPSADVAVMNGGGLRSDLPAGELSYASLHTAFPFDNRFALVRVTGAELAELFARAAGREGSFLSVSGMRVSVRCEGHARVASLVRDDGRAIAPDAALTVAMSDFMATGGDSFFSSLIEHDPSRVTIEEGELIRDAMAAVLRTRSGSIAPGDLADPAHPRVAVDGARPLRCE